MLLLPVAGCGDACQRACASARQAVGRCLDDWGARWEDVEAASGADFRQDCEDEWERISPTLEARELDQALQTCARVVDEAPTLSCDALRAIYLAPTH